MTDTLLVAHATTGTLAERSLEHRFGDLSPACRVISRRSLGTSTVQHIVIAPSGVWVIAERRSTGRPAPQGGLLSRRTETLQLGRRNAARLVESVRRQTEAVRAELGVDVPVAGLLCILDADWPIFGGAFTVDGVRVLWPKKACDIINTGEQLSAARINAITDQLDAALPPAPSGRSHARHR